MRYSIPLLLICALLLAACGGDAGPSETVDTTGTDTTAPADSGSGETAAPFVVVTLAPPDPDALPVAPPGTLVASATEDPNADLPFDRILLTRYSGPEGAEVIFIELFGDGTYTRNEESGTISAERVQRINDLIREINFFGMQGTLLGPSAETEDYRYRLTIERGPDDRSLTAQDGFYPREFQRLLAEVMSVGFLP